MKSRENDIRGAKDLHMLGCTLASLGMKDSSADGTVSRQPVPSVGLPQG